MTPEKLMEQVEFFGSAKASYAVAHAANETGAAANFSTEALNALLTVKAEVERQAAELAQAQDRLDGDAWDKLTGTLNRRTAERDEARQLLDGWDKFANRIAELIPEHYDGEGSMQSCIEDWARDADAVIRAAHTFRKRNRITADWERLEAAVEKIYPGEDYL
jgi:hypothetical protein